MTIYSNFGKLITFWTTDRLREKTEEIAVEWPEGFLWPEGDSRNHNVFAAVLDAAGLDAETGEFGRHKPKGFLGFPAIGCSLGGSRLLVG